MRRGENDVSKYHGLILEALSCYTSDEKMNVKEKEARAFAEYMLTSLSRKYHLEI